jgi:hypothetical protein
MCLWIAWWFSGEYPAWLHSADQAFFWLWAAVCAGTTLNWEYMLQQNFEANERAGRKFAKRELRRAHADAVSVLVGTLSSPHTFALPSPPSVCCCRDRRGDGPEGVPIQVGILAKLHTADVHLQHVLWWRGMAGSSLGVVPQDGCAVVPLWLRLCAWIRALDVLGDAARSEGKRWLRTKQLSYLCIAPLLTRVRLALWRPGSSSLCRLTSLSSSSGSSCRWSSSLRTVPSSATRRRTTRRTIGCSLWTSQQYTLVAGLQSYLGIDGGRFTWFQPGTMAHASFL